MSLRPINRIKHVVDAQGTVTAAQSTIPLIDADDNPTLGSPTLVQTGSTVNAIYLHVEVSHTANVGLPNIYMAIMKNPGNNIVAPQADAVGISDAKKFIIHQEMILMSGDAGSGLPRPLFNGVIVIPKGYRRFGPDDRLMCLLVLSDADMTADFCLQAHYKEFR